MTRVLHFWIGPVQGFIGSARRTRDLWAGSFLLSWLAGHAMAAVLRSGGTLSTPWVYGSSPLQPVDATAEVVEPTLRAILQPRRSGVRWGEPLAGTLANQFRAEIPAGFEPAACRDAALAAWRKLAKAVFAEFVSPAIRVAKDLDDAERQAICELWDRQIPATGDDPFWEFVWVVGDDPAWADEVRWLDRRKTWRTHEPPAEPRGFDHCAMMPDFAELSGFVRSARKAHDKASSPREKQDAFWDALRRRTRQVVYPKASRDPTWLKTLELRENERLCAIALVKRLFPLLLPGALADAVGWIPAAPEFPDAANDGAAALALRNWPSTAFMSAVHWIERAWGDAEGPGRDACRTYADAQLGQLGVRDALPERPQQHKIRALSGFVDPGDPPAPAKFAYLDGGLFFPRTLETNRYASTEAERADKARRLVEAFDTLRKAVGAPGSPLPAPSTFYALVFMDGDSLGRWVSRKRDLAQAVSAGLRTFSTAALAAVRDNNGVPVYAGADDVAALFPIEDAIPAAIRLRGLYEASLNSDHTRATALGTGLDPARDATISAGLVFADFQAPLSQVREEARRLLDKVAKAGNGRDSIAISILKSGGTTAQWVTRWDAERIRGFGVTAISDPPPALLWSMARRQAGASGDPPISSRFPYVVRERLGDLFHGQQAAIGPAQAMSLLRAEFEDVRGAAARKLEADQIDDLMSQILHLSRVHPGPSDGSLGPLSLDGLVIAQFLADACIWPSRTGADEPP